MLTPMKFAHQTVENCELHSGCAFYLFRQLKTYI